MEYWNNFAMECANWHRRAAGEAGSKRIRLKNERAMRFWLAQIGR